MDNFLLSYALEDVWCSPRQDNQWVFEPKRISSKQGALSYANLLGLQIKLPDSHRYYHVFQIGQLDPVFLNLIRQEPEWAYHKWFKVSNTMNIKNLEVTIYNADGVNLPRTDSYYMFTNDRCLFFITPKQTRFPLDIETERIYLRFYSNAYFSDNSANGTRNIEVGCFKPLSINEILAAEQVINTYLAKVGHTRCYINGILSDNFNLGNVNIGDYLEYVYDGSVKKVIRWKMADLFNFRSELDGVFKYLLHYAGDNDKVIDYQDDLDIHIVFDRPSQFKRGLYYNRNYPKNHRMITHKDYAVDSNMAMGLRDRLQALLGLATIPVDNTYIEVAIRESKTNRKLGFENQRIFELYKLPDEVVYSSLIGLNAVVPEWYCANLEKSHTIEMMRRTWTEFDIGLIEKGYGYNAISKIIGDAPVKPLALPGDRSFPMAPGLQIGSTVYEFSGDGLLLGHYYHLNGSTYRSANPDTRMIEAIVGEGGLTSNTVYGSDNIPVSPNWDYRVYRCYLQDGLPDNQWEDITGSAIYKVENNVLKWLGPNGAQWLCVRSDNKFITYDYELEHSSGILNFVVAENPTGNPNDDLDSIQIPFAQLDIWMNKHKLIRNLDYFVRWPKVIVTNKTFLLRGPTSLKQQFHIRASRLASSLTALDKIEDYGWIYHGSLSNNNVFDLRDDRVLQMNVGGQLMAREDLVFAENRPGPKLIDALNGFPYQIKDLIVPFKQFTEKSAYELRPLSQDIDTRISAFMTEHYGPMEPEGISSIGPRYPVVSPFLSHILYLLANKLLNIPADRLLGEYEIREACRIHEWLLEFDPLSEVNQPDIRFAFTIPHGSFDPVILGFVEYRFFVSVTELYGYPGLVYKDYVAILQY